MKYVIFKSFAMVISGGFRNRGYYPSQIFEILYIFSTSKAISYIENCTPCEMINFMAL